MIALGSSVMRTVSRREVLQAGGLGLGLHGLGLSTLLQARQASGATSPHFGRARSCILLFMWGGPAQQDTWDMKPLAPVEFRGEFQPIGTSVPGLQV